MPQSIESALKNYLNYLSRVKHDGALTIAHYHDYLVRFIEMQSIKQTLDITLPKIDSFRRSLSAKGLALTTINYHLIALRGFIRWLPRPERRTHHNSIVLSPAKHQLTPRLQNKSIAKIFAQEPATSGLQALRDRTLLELMTSTDIRLNEIPGLRTDAYDPRKKTITITNRRKRVLNLNHHTSYFLSQYLERRTDQAAYLFTRHDRAFRDQQTQPMSTRSIQRLVKRYGIRFGVSDLTPRAIEQTRKNTT